MNGQPDRFSDSPACDSTLLMRDGEEVVILVDGNDKVVGTGDKLATHRDGTLHRAFSVII